MTDFESWYNKKDFQFDTKISFQKINNNIEIIIKKKIGYANLVGELEQYVVYSLQTEGLKKIVINQSLLKSNDNFFLLKHICFSEFEIVFEIKNTNDDECIYINCEKLVLETRPNLFEVAMSQINKYEVKFTLKQKLPAPKYLLEKLKAKGFPSVFTGYFGEKIPLEEISDNEYSGFSIKPLQADTENCSFKLGIYFWQAREIKSGAEILLDLQNTHLVEFWRVTLQMQNLIEDHWITHAEDCQIIESFFCPKSIIQLQNGCDKQHQNT